jgi:broad specificity phosphatase PhoE
MRTLLTVIRHGVTDWNQAGIAQGWAPIPLNAQGQAQARLLAEAMAAEGQVDALYSSDQRRCMQTAAPLAEAMNLPIVPDERLREYDLGWWQGLSGSEWREYDPDNYARYRADPVNVPFPGGESRTMLTTRVVAALEEFLARHAGAHLVIVTHGGPVRAILRHLDVWPFPPGSKSAPPPSNTGRFVLAIEDGRAELLRLADTSHLPPELVT